MSYVKGDDARRGVCPRCGGTFACVELHKPRCKGPLDPSNRRNKRCFFCNRLEGNHGLVSTLSRHIRTVSFFILIYFMRYDMRKKTEIK